MKSTPKHTHISYRCPECLDAVLGIASETAISMGMLRLKCRCGKSYLDITPFENYKIKLTIPCVLCKDTHNFTVSKSLMFEREHFNLLCPYSNMEIGFFGDEETISASLSDNQEKLNKILGDLELDNISDIQPEEMSDAEILPPPEIYDTIRLVLKELEADGKADCPCHGGSYELRYTDDGIQAYCPICGAVYDFPCSGTLGAERYLELDSIKLS